MWFLYISMIICQKIYIEQKSKDLMTLLLLGHRFEVKKIETIKFAG